MRNQLLAGAEIQAMSVSPEVTGGVKAGRGWWTRLPELADAAPSIALRRADYRFGDKTLALQSAHPALLEEFESAYGDCAERISAQPDLRCHAIPIAGSSIVAVRLEADEIPSLFDAALSLVRPRENLQQY